MIFDCDVRYCDHEKGLLDVMAPDGDGPFPLVVCLHGGGWQGGSKEGFHLFAEWLLPLGIASVIPNYRLTDTAAHPAQEQDVFAALDWAVAHADEYGFDMSRVGLTGGSAGGHLAALVGCRGSMPSNERAYRIRCMYPLFGPMDMPRFVDDNPGILPVVEALIGGTIEEKRDALIDASPMEHIHGDAPACCCIHGDADDLVPYSQSEIFVETLNALGIEAEAVIVPGIGHAAHEPETDPPEPLGGLERYHRFFRKHLIET